MTKTISFNELRRVKDSLPDGTMHRIADELGLKVETVRNYFGGANFKDGRSSGIHIEPGPDGGIVVLSDLNIWNKAQEILTEYNNAHDIITKEPHTIDLEDEGDEPKPAETSAENVEP